MLIAGGCTRPGCEDVGAGARAERFDPARERFRATGRLGVPRVSHTATRLAGGRVLIAGGYPGEGSAPLRSAELYDAGAGRFSPTAGAPASRRAGHAAVRLRDGRVLLIGGIDGTRPLRTCELFDPRRGAFRRTGSLGVPRSIPAAALLPDGRVLVTGGSRDGERAPSGAEVYDPRTGRWSPTGSMRLARMKHAALTLAGGKVLVVGGSPSDDFDDRLDGAETYDPAAGRFRSAAPMHAARFKLPDAVAASRGAAVVAGGAGGVEVFDAGRRGFARAPGPDLAGFLFTAAAALRDGRVLITGGYDDDIDVHAEAYLYRPRG